MSRIHILGVGAVSPAGWGVAPLRNALRAGSPLPIQELRTLAAERGHAARLVPSPHPRPAWLAHPRLRRAGRISHFALAACLEALGADAASADAARSSRLGIVAGTHAGSLGYSERFYEDVLRDASTASPILFPETVINAPASHVAAYLDCRGPSASVIADQTAFVQALVMGVHWLIDDRVDRCLVLGFDEVAWTVGEGLDALARGVTPAEGAGALLIAREPACGPGVDLERITDAQLYAGASSKEPAVRAMRAQMPETRPDALLVDSLCGVARVDRAEKRAWDDWTGPRSSPRRVLGEGLAAGTAWQFVAAWAALMDQSSNTACLSVVGGNLEAVGVCLAYSGASPKGGRQDQEADARAGLLAGSAA